MSATLERNPVWKNGPLICPKENLAMLNQETASREGALKQEKCYIALAAMGQSPMFGQFIIAAETFADLAVMWSNLFPEGSALNKELCKRITIINAPEHQA